MTTRAQSPGGERPTTGPIGDIADACDHCDGKQTMRMWCCPNQHVWLCQPCYDRMVKVESADPIECPLRQYEATPSGDSDARV